ncbi:MAG: hypothetical protein OXK17_09700 [Thaumarchaeota archaeon]|nr:hypothetical protein [Nitrososphaerota archaeon]
MAAVRKRGRRRQWGEMARSKDMGAAVISPTDFANHLYVVGASGSGKTSLIRLLAKHLEAWNLNGTFPNAFIYVDPKGDDSYKFVRQCDPDTVGRGFVHFLDPQKTKFSINPLELPTYQEDEREELVSRYVGYFMKTIEEWYQQSATFVQMERIFRALLFYVYMEHDSPTFLDIHDMILKMQESGHDALPQIAGTFGTPNREMEQALLSIAALKGDAFVPLLNRIEQFATDPVLKRMFSVRRGTVDFGELIKPGTYTVVRISPLNMPHHVQPLAMQAFILKLWFAIQERANRLLGEERTQVVLALDEFQIVKDLQVLQLMLEQARSLGLGLVLSHQTTEQISDTQLGLITGNSGTQLVGKVNGKDAVRMAQIWDPQFKGELTRLLASQEYFHWSIREKAPPGKEQPLPVQFWLGAPPALQVSADAYDAFLAAQLAKYGRGAVEDTIVRQTIAARNKWLEGITIRFPAHMEWRIMVMLLGKPLQQVDMVSQLPVSNRSEVLDILKKMQSDRLVRKTDPGNRMSKYELTPEARSTYFEPRFDEVGSAAEIDDLTRRVFNGYLDMGLFVAVASQKVTKGRDRTDLVAYDYEDDAPISVEIESVVEVQSHPEHVRYNMVKWRDMGFGRCHVWSKSPKVQQIYDRLSDEEKRGVRVTVI